MVYNTEKRTLLIEFLSKNSKNAYTAEEICHNILEGGRGKSTVYRLISRLVEEGILHRISDAKTRRITYQYIGSRGCAEHLHLKCTGCGKLIHLDDTTSHILERRIFKSEGFALDSGAMIFGKCEGCLCGERGAR